MCGARRAVTFPCTENADCGSIAIMRYTCGARRAVTFHRPEKADCGSITAVCATCAALSPAGGLLGNHYCMRYMHGSAGCRLSRDVLLLSRKVQIAGKLLLYTLHVRCTQSRDVSMYRKYGLRVNCHCALHVRCTPSRDVSLSRKGRLRVISCCILYMCGAG